jgi:hypothetical protein
MPDVAASRKRQIVDDVWIPDAGAWMAGRHGVRHIAPGFGDATGRDRAGTGEADWPNRLRLQAGSLS